MRKRDDAALGRFYEPHDPLQARQWYRKDLDIWTNWPRIAPSSHYDQARRETAVRNLARCS